MQSQDSSGHDRRRSGRIRSQDVVTRIGEVIDLSATGMRIMCEHHQPPEAGSIMSLELIHPQGSVTVKSRIVRVTSAGEDRYELGVAFEDVSPTTATGLLVIARLAMQSIAVEYLEHQDR